MKNTTPTPPVYTLDCDYYNRNFNSLDDLLEDILSSGMDPSYNILKNGHDTEELASEYFSH